MTKEEYNKYYEMYKYVPDDQLEERLQALPYCNEAIVISSIFWKRESEAFERLPEEEKQLYRSRRWLDIL